MYLERKIFGRMQNELIVMHREDREIFERMLVNGISAVGHSAGTPCLHVYTIHIYVLYE